MYEPVPPPRRPLTEKAPSKHMDILLDIRLHNSRKPFDICRIMEPVRRQPMKLQVSLIQQKTFANSARLGNRAPQHFTRSQFAPCGNTVCRHLVGHHHIPIWPLRIHPENGPAQQQRQTREHNTQEHRSHNEERYRLTRETISHTIGSAKEEEHNREAEQNSSNTAILLPLAHVNSLRKKHLFGAPAERNRDWRIHTLIERLLSSSTEPRLCRITTERSQPQNRNRYHAPSPRLLLRPQPAHARPAKLTARCRPDRGRRCRLWRARCRRNPRHPRAAGGRPCRADEP